MASLLEKRSEIHLGDLIAALSQLPWQGDEQAEKIARSLGFAPQALLMQQHQSQKSRSAHNEKTSPARHGQKNITETNPSITTPSQPRPSIALPSGIISGPLQPKADLPPPTVELIKPSADEAFTHYDEREYKATPHQPLFPETTSRGIFIALLQSTRDSRRVDLTNLVRLSAKGLPPKQLPYCLEATLQNGCQLLLDYGETMAPWKNDLQSVAIQIETIVGRELVTTYRFKDEPGSATHRARFAKPKTWSPKSKVPVLVATDFGLPLLQSEFRIQKHWKKLIQRCEETSSPVIFLIPWAFDTWLEKVLGPYPYFFAWSPETSSNQIRSLVGNGHNPRS